MHSRAENRWPVENIRHDDQKLQQMTTIGIFRVFIYKQLDNIKQRTTLIVLIDIFIQALHSF